MFLPSGQASFLSLSGLLDAGDGDPLAAVLGLEIAALLHISEATVKTHVGHIMTKLGLRDRIQAVVYRYETGVVSPQGRPTRLTSG